MRIHSGWATFIAGALLLSGCAGERIEMATSTPSQVSASAAAGRAKELRIGARRAYWVWKDVDGVWHVRTTAGRNGRGFKGAIRPLPGATLADIKPVGLGPNAELETIGRMLTFKFRTKGGMDGFDFRVNGEACLECDLRIDDDGDPAHIYIGEKQQRPESEHFMLCP